jgi:hypothetical protein
MKRRTFLLSAGAAALTIPLIGCEHETAGQALADRWLRYIRKAGSDSAPSTWKFLGGDVTDCFIRKDGRPTWMYCDGFAGTRVLADDTYEGNALPFRNGCIVEQSPGSFSGAYQIMTSRNLWLDGAAMGVIPEGTHWWPIAAINVNGVVYVNCWQTRSFDGTPYGTLLDNHIVKLGGYMTYESHVEMHVPVDNFWIDGFVQGNGYVYVYGEEFHPDYEGGYGINDPENHYTTKRVARVTTASFPNMTTAEYWNGFTWVPEIEFTVPLMTPTGGEVRGDAGVKRVAADHWVLAAHRLAGPNLDVYRASAPQGPWSQIAEVALPGQGEPKHGGTQCGQLVKILPPQVGAPPAGYSLAIISRNILNGDNLFGIAGRNINCYAPQIATIPHE